ncbi:pseudouridine synthase [Porphyromonadaceae bacterium W3.11]|nr:pseudouridine synthase [Porphyromonadaceae bacterium W3.11]
MNRDKKKTISQDNPTPVQESYRAQVSMPVLELLMEKSSRNRTAAKKLLSSGRVSLNGKSVTNALMTAEVGASITVHRGAPPLPFSHRFLEIIWENDDYIVVYKKRGMPTVNTAHKDREETALWVLSRHYKITNPDAKIFMINRLDRSTAGFIVFAKSVEAKELMTKSWSKNVTKQLFVACIEGEVEEKNFLLTTSSSQDFSGKGKVTVAKIKVDKSSSRGMMHIVQADMVGARIFSLRKVFGDNNFSIFGDVRSKSSFMTDKDIALEQISLEFSLPKSGQQMSFERAYPTHYFQLLKEDK